MRRVGFIVAGVLATLCVLAPPAMAGLNAGGLQSGGAIVNGSDITPNSISTAASIAAGTTIASGTTLRFGTQLLNGNAQMVMSTSQLGFNENDINGNTSNAAGNTAFAFWNQTTMTAGVDRYIAVLYADAFLTPRARIFTDGTYQNLVTVGTAASGTGVTANYVGAQRGWSAKTTVINTAMTAAGSTDITIATTPVNTRIVSVTADVTQVFTGGALTAVTVQCGNVAGGTQYLLANSVFTAQNTWGDANAEIGLNLIPGNAAYAPFGTSAAGVPGAITVSCRFTCTTANCNAATQGSVTFYVEGVTY